MATFRDADPNTPGIQIRRDASGTLQGDTTQSVTPKNSNRARTFGPDSAISEQRRKNLPPNAVPKAKTSTEAKIVDKSGDNDWRVNITIPPAIKELNSSLLTPLYNSGDRMIFPFTPSVIFSHSASYSSMQPIHTNYPFYNYQNSSVDAITVSGDFFIETNELGTNESGPGTWVPTQSLMAVTLQPIYSRTHVEQFSLSDFVSGELISNRGFL